MAVPPGIYRLRAVPNWQRPPPQVGGMYATYDRGEQVVLGPEAPGFVERQKVSQV